MNNSRFVELVKDSYPDIEWDKFFEADRALNWELWHGPLPSDYWTEVEPLKFYEWKGWEKAQTDIIEMLSDLPDQLYYSDDIDFISINNPEDDEENWFVDENDNYEWTGFDYWKLKPRKFLMHEESYNQIF
jgi:hypothetical protein